MKNYAQSNMPDDDIIEVKVFDEPLRTIKEGYPDILNHPQHYKAWLKPSQAQVQVVCHQTVLDRIQQHATSYPAQEIGGILVGQYSRYQDSGYVEISTYLPAPPEGRGQNSASHFTFTETIWAEMLRDKDRNPALEQMEIVGWFHSHPNWGTQPSSLDIDIQMEHFRYEWQVALIYDPYRHEGDFYLWDNGSLVRAPGFYEVFSRVRPKPITEWQNYLQIERLQRERIQKRERDKLDDAGQKPSDETQDDSAPPLADKANGAEGSLSSGAVVPVSDQPFRPNSEQISITRDDVWRNMLRRNWNELILIVAPLVMLLLISYLAYGYFSTPQDDVAASTVEQPLPERPEPQMFAKGEYPLEYGMWFTVDGELIGDGAINIAANKTNNATICVYNSHYAQGSSQEYLYLLTMSSTSGFAQTEFVAPHDIYPSKRNSFCLVYDLSGLETDLWRGELYVFRPNDEELGPIGFQQGALEPLETSFDVRLLSDEGASDEGVADE